MQSPGIIALAEHRRKADKGPKDFLSDLFSAQRALAEDPAQYTSALCPRRAGKTFTNSRILAADAHKRQGARCLYVALTARTAENLMWRPLCELLDSRGVEYTANASKQQIRIDQTQGEVWLRGANDIRAIERLRGFAFDRVILDECASFGSYVESMIDDVLDATLTDYRGRLTLTGTPSAACAGLFYDATAGNRTEYSRHRWDILDNNRMPRWSGRKDWRQVAERFLEEKRSQKGWSEDNPIFLREWRGRWVRSADSLVYRFDRDRNTYKNIPERKGWRHVIGVDLGFQDSFAIVVWGYAADDPCLYEIDSFVAPCLVPSEWAAEVGKRIEKYDPDRIVADTGGLGRAIVEEWRQRHGMPIHAAEKTDKWAYVEMFNSDLHESMIKLRAGGQYAGQIEVLQRDPVRPQKEDDRFRNDLCDAGLYGWREAKHWTESPEPDPGLSRDIGLLLEREADKEAEKIRQEIESPWWDL